MQTPRQALRKHHLIENRRVEIILGITFFILGCFLIYDAFDARGKRMPWPMGGLAPW